MTKSMMFDDGEKISMMIDEEENDDDEVRII